MKTLTFTTLFPNSAQPVHGIFVANRLSHVLATGRVTTRIVAPVPFFPSTHARFGAYARYAAVPRLEHRFDVPVLHPRYAAIPKVGMTVAPTLLYLGVRRTVAAILAEKFDFDLIDAHYFYPDGVAAALLGQSLGKPVLITARGSDISEIANYALPRKMILWAARQAAGLITVCQALKDRLVELGVAAERITVLRNGVDLTKFRPLPQAAIRARHGLVGKVVLSVGNLIPLKGHDIVIDAVARLPETTLLIAGKGPELHNLQRRCGDHGISDRVRFLGQVAPSELAEYYSAADVLVLASSREGWANVLLEAMACGTPVIASNVWGTPEVVTEPAAGVLVSVRTGSAFTAALERLLASPPDRAATRAYAERFGWEPTTAGQLELFDEVVRRRKAG
jgi:teichuronic acid biosynthesis glycosyltransferase TuaC